MTLGEILNSLNLRFLLLKMGGEMASLWQLAVERKVCQAPGPVLGALQTFAEQKDLISWYTWDLSSAVS